MNVSVERKVVKGVDQIVGYIRIRSKTQGIALSLGDRIQSTQRSTALGKSKAGKDTSNATQEESKGESSIGK